MKSDGNDKSTGTSRPRSAPRPVHPYVLEDVAFTKAELLAARQRDTWIVVPH